MIEWTLLWGFSYRDNRRGKQWEYKQTEKSLILCAGCLWRAFGWRLWGCSGRVWKGYHWVSRPPAIQQDQQMTNHTGRNSIPPPSPSFPLSPSSQMPLVHFLNEWGGGAAVVERRDASLHDTHTHAHAHTVTSKTHICIKAREQKHKTIDFCISVYAQSITLSVTVKRRAGVYLYL